MVEALEDRCLLDRSWSTVAPMPTARSSLAAAPGSDGRIYAIGGNTNQVVLNTVEAYNPWTAGWSTVAPMPTARTDLAAAMGSDGRIYAIGGQNGVFFNTVEAYNPWTNSWSAVAPMPTARSSLAAVPGSDGRIYAIGGFDGSNRLNTVEAYNPWTNSWSTVAPMPTVRYVLAAAKGSDGLIYAIGGSNPPDTLNTVEAFTAGVTGPNVPSNGRSNQSGAVVLPDPVTVFPSMSADSLSLVSQGNGSQGSVAQTTGSAILVAVAASLDVQSPWTAALAPDAGAISSNILAALAQGATSADTLEPLNPAFLDLMALSLLA
jgi:hypothetical protein